MITSFCVSTEVSEALEAGRPVVALESVAISHGFPKPHNFDAALEFEEILRSSGVVAATIAVLDGNVHVGLDRAQLKRVSEDTVHKASVRDLPVLMAKKLSGATTIAATAYLASKAGIEVFAAEGLGGVHPSDVHPDDESADLLTLATTPITLVCSGIKSLLDIAATLERLDTLSVPVVGYGTNRFPRFWVSESDHELDWAANSPDDVVSIMTAQRALGSSAGLLVANPVAPDAQLDLAMHDRAVSEAYEAARDEGVVGKDVTPFVMDRVVEATEGRSVQVNREMIRSNVALAGAIATAWSTGVHVGLS